MIGPCSPERVVLFKPGSTELGRLENDDEVFAGQGRRSRRMGGGKWERRQEVKH